MKRAKRTILFYVLVTIIVLSMVTIANAHGLSYNWQGDLVGYCGITEGG